MRILLGIASLPVLFVGILTYLGFVPVLSPLVVKPRDLGSKVEPQFIQEFDTKYGMLNKLPDGIVPAGREPVYSGSVPLDVTLTSDDVTSILDYWRGQYAKTPIHDVQVRFNADGTTEASGVLDTAAAVAMAKQLGYSDADIKKGESYVSYVAGELPFYVKGVADVHNNNVSISTDAIEIGRLPVPSQLVDPLVHAVEDAIDRRLAQVPGLHVTSLENTDGELHLVGTVPNSIQ